MASDLSLYTGNRFLRWLAGNPMPTPPVAVYIGLFNGNPKAGGNEITTSVRSGGRLACPYNAPAAGSANTMANSADVDFGGSENGSLSLSHVGWFDAATAGNLLYSKPMPGGAVAISQGTIVRFNGGDLTITAGSAT